MSAPDSWEDEAAQDDSLSKQTQQMNLNGQQSFQPGARTFQPAAQAFTPGQSYQQYGGGYNQQYGQYYGQGYGGQQQQQQQQYPQYGQQGGYGQQGYGQVYGQQQQQQGGQYNQGYNQYQQYQQYQNPQQGQYQQQPPKIAKRGDDTAAPAAGGGAAAQPKAKVLSISGDAPKAKVLSISGDAPKAKVLSIGSTSAPAAAKKESAPATKSAEEGAKATAVKAIEKTGESATPKSTGSGRTSPTPSSGRDSPTPAEIRAEKAEKQAQREADAVAKEIEAVDEEVLAEVFGKEHVNVIFIGHVDAGKSTLGGSILYATGMVDERTMDKYKREAKEAGRETWYLSWALDLTKEERSKGKTVEVGRGFFETEKRRYSILDAPGHKTYVPNMIGGASQADVGILVISARKGEYETGFEKGGQTREHAMLAKTQGVNQLLVAVNKMDDPTVEWSEERYKECTTKVLLFLKGLNYDIKKDVTVMPISGQTGVGIKDRVPKDVCPWFEGPSLLEYLDNLTNLERKLTAPFMMPISGKYKELGTMIEGKIEAGVLKKDSKYLMMPNRDEVSISALYGETEDEIQQAACGEQVRVRLRGIEEEDVLPGFVLCAPKRPVHNVTTFEAQISLLDLKSILSAGFNCVLHVHSAIEEVTFDALLHKLEKKTGRKSKKPPAFASKGMSIIARLKVQGGAGSVCIERFEDYPQMGRFTLRDQVRRAHFQIASPSPKKKKKKGAKLD
jgi:peptide chain release factor subunit 3